MERLHGDDPSERMVVAKFLARNGPQRLILPGPEYALRPIVQQAEPKMRARLLKWGSARRGVLPLPPHWTKKNRLEARSTSDLLGPEARSFRLGVLDLTLRTPTSVPLTTMEDARPVVSDATCLIVGHRDCRPK